MKCQALTVYEMLSQDSMCGEPATAKLEGWPVCDEHAIKALEGAYFFIVPIQQEDEDLIELLGDPK